MDILDLVKQKFVRKGMRWPENADQAVMWADTELAEVKELLLARIGGWTRSHPKDHPKFSRERLADELADALFMILVAGYVEGIDPLQYLVRRMAQQCGYQHPEQFSIF